MRLTANQVTLARLVLLPLPVGMVYLGRTDPWLLAALAVFVVLGLTDALDGYLARRYGSTPLGALLDPIADKIFLVAAIVPLADFRIVPPILVLVLFVRELAITMLRSIALEEGWDFKTSKVAKLKTTVQMAGAGFVLLIQIFEKGPAITWLMGIAAAGSLLPVAILLLRGKTPGWRSLSGAGLICSVAALRGLFDAPVAAFAIMLVIVAFTVYSGLEYLWAMRGVLAVRFRRAPIEIARLAGLSLAVPVSLLPALNLDGAPSFTILGILAAEVAAGGLDNSLSQLKLSRSAGWDLARAAAQAVAGALVLSSLLQRHDPLSARRWAIAALAVTLADVLGRFWRHRETFRTVPL